MQELSKRELMRKISETEFAIADLMLFMDTHPGDAQAFAEFCSQVEKRNHLAEIYKKQYGPLTIYDEGGLKYNWDTQKWPWEGGDY